MGVRALGVDLVPAGVEAGGTRARPDTGQGTSVALSGDGNTALVGDPYDNGGTGATWVFARSGSTWTQQGPKLVAAGSLGQRGHGGLAEWRCRPMGTRR